MRNLIDLNLNVVRKFHCNVNLSQTCRCCWLCSGWFRHTYKEGSQKASHLEILQCRKWLEMEAKCLLVSSCLLALTILQLEFHCAWTDFYQNSRCFGGIFFHLWKLQMKLGKPIVYLSPPGFQELLSGSVHKGSQGI